MFTFTFDDLSISPHLFDRIERGAAWLDANRPGWRDEIDLDGLDLGSPCRCVLGQTFEKAVPEFGHFVSGYGVVWEAVRAAAPGYETANEWMCQHGFESDEFVSYEVLTDAWADYLQEG